jgi:hypothetical protein
MPSLKETFQQSQVVRKHKSRFIDAGNVLILPYTLLAIIHTAVNAAMKREWQ